MMKAFSFQCSQNHDVVTRMISSKNALKARLRDSRETDVSEDEGPPVAPPSDFVFLLAPSGLIW